MDNVTIRVADQSDRDRILFAYRAWNYQGGFAPADLVWLAESRSELIGVVRLSLENGVLVLRGMRVAEPWRRRGVGSRLLHALAGWLGDRVCYCLPYSHLVSFYSQIGFAELTPVDAPPFLAHRLADYRHRELDVTLMVRPAYFSFQSSPKKPAAAILPGA